MAAQDRGPSGPSQTKLAVTCPCGKQILTSPRAVQLMCPDCGRLLDVPANAPADQGVAPPARPQDTTTKAVVIGTAVGAVIVGLIVACVILAVLAMRHDEPKVAAIVPIRELIAKGDTFLLQGSLVEARASYEEALRLTTTQGVQDSEVTGELAARMTSTDIAQFKATGDRWWAQGKFDEAKAAYGQAQQLMDQPNVLGDSMRAELASRLADTPGDSATGAGTGAAAGAQAGAAAGADVGGEGRGDAAVPAQGQDRGRGTAAGPPRSSTLEERAARMRKLLEERRGSRSRAGGAPGRTTPAASIPAGAGQQDTGQQPDQRSLTDAERKAKGLVLFRGNWVSRQARYRALLEEETLTKGAEERERKQKQAADSARLDAERFRQEQLAKGLVEFQGKWVRPEERDRVVREQQMQQQAQAERERKKAEEARQKVDRFKQEQLAKGLVEYQGRWVTKGERDRAVREQKARMKRMQEERDEAQRDRKKQLDKGLVEFRGKWVKPKERDKILKKEAAQRQAAQDRSRKAAEQARQTAVRFRQEQLAKGLVEFRGRWVTPEQRAKMLLDEEEQKKQSKLEEERRRLQPAADKAEEAKKEETKREEVEGRTQGALVPGTPVPRK